MNFGAYIKTTRQERHLTLDQISADTKIKRSLLADLEANDLSRWPKYRVYRHGYIRSYAMKVGLNPTEVIAHFDREFPDEHPVAFHSSSAHSKKGSGAFPTPFSQPSPQQLTRNAAVLAVALGALLGVALSVLDTRESGAGVTYGRSTIVDRLSTRIVLLSGRRDTNIGLASQELTPALGVTSTSYPSLAGSVVAPASDIEISEIEGELRIVSTPPEAFVTVNGIGRGKTPVRVRYLPVGSYTIRAVHPGYKSGETRVNLSPEQPNRTVSVVLRDDAAN